MKGQRNGVSGFRGLNIGTTPPFMLRSKRLFSLWFLVVSHHHWFHVEIEELQIIPWINNWLRGIRHCWLWRISRWNPKNRWKIMQTRIGGMCNSKWERKFFLSSWHTVKVSGTTEKWEVRILWTLSGARKDWSYGISSSITTLDNDTQCIPCFTVEKESGRTKGDSRVGKEEVLIWRVWNECPTWSYFGETLEFEGGKWRSIDQMQRPTGDWSHLGRDEFMLQFPNFHLEDKVSWGGIVRPLVIHTY